MLFLALLALIGLLAIAVTLRAVFTDGYAPVPTRWDDGFDPLAGYPAHATHPAHLKGRA